jgi:hypothetical protein
VRKITLLLVNDGAQGDFQLLVHADHQASGLRRRGWHGPAHVLDLPDLQARYAAFVNDIHGVILSKILKHFDLLLLNCP